MTRVVCAVGVVHSEVQAPSRSCSFLTESCKFLTKEILMFKILILFLLSSSRIGDFRLQILYFWKKVS